MTTAQRAHHVLAGALTAAFILIALMAFNVMDTPWEMWAEHQATKRMMDVQWGIRTFPQETDQ